ncbi:conserved hypothetical protein [Cenarchaeum symbiosum A]|uniref:Uncharacterized protein n=1 Tax=Cenarchaeum symbiosum (strain A) TaxID=414004 RepID=A0RUM0_CENSY|nr:conserved hypothetical protein [Cenarchaeum symbiosum A]
MQTHAGTSPPRTGTRAAVHELYLVTPWHDGTWGKQRPVGFRLKTSPACRTGRRGIRTVPAAPPARSGRYAVASRSADRDPFSDPARQGYGMTAAPPARSGRYAVASRSADRDPFSDPARQGYGMTAAPPARSGRYAVASRSADRDPFSDPARQGYGMTAAPPARSGRYAVASRRAARDGAPFSDPARRVYGMAAGAPGSLRWMGCQRTGAETATRTVSHESGICGRFSGPAGIRSGVYGASEGRQMHYLHIRAGILLRAGSACPRRRTSCFQARFYHMRHFTPEFVPLQGPIKKDFNTFRTPLISMTLPKGFGSGGAGGADAADVEKMIGRRIENMTGIITLSFIAAWLATFAGTAVGYFYYPWAYPTNSGHYAFIVLTIIEAIGYLFAVKIAEEGSRKKSNLMIGSTLGGVTVLTMYLSIFVGW